MVALVAVKASPALVESLLVELPVPIALEAHVAVRADILAGARVWTRRAASADLADLRGEAAG